MKIRKQQYRPRIKLCVHEGCIEKTMARGYCRKHYQSHIYDGSLAVIHMVSHNWICNCPTDDLRSGKDKFCKKCEHTRPISF